MINIEFVATLRNTDTEKLDLLRNKQDGWLRFRLVKVDLEGNVNCKILAISPEEFKQIKEILK